MNLIFYFVKECGKRFAVFTWKHDLPSEGTLKTGKGASQKQTMQVRRARGKRQNLIYIECNTNAGDIPADKSTDIYGLIRPSIFL